MPKTRPIFAPRLIELSSYLNGFSHEDGQRDALGPTLSQVLDDNVERLRTICSRHFGPSFEKLQVLTDLRLEGTDPELMLDALHKALDVATSADGEDLARLDPEAVATLSNMVTELETLRTAIDEAQTPAHRENLRDRFARSAAAIAATFGRYVEKGKAHADRPAAWVDAVLKNFKRVKGLQDLLDFLEKLFQHGGG